MTLTHRQAAVALLLSLGFVALYLAFPTKVYYWDGIVFAQGIEDAASTSGANISLAHPNHLVYNFAGYFFWQLLRTFAADVRALTALQILNSILSAASAAILFLILRQTLHSIYFTVCLTLLFALSATWWKFSTDANAYVSSVLFLLLSLFLVLPDRKARPLLVAITFCAAMSFHELAVLAFPVFALGVYLQDGALSIRRRFTNAVVFAVASFVLIVAMYALVFYVATGSMDVMRLLRWTTSYSPDADTRFALWSNLTYSLRGEVRLFFGGRMNLLSGLLNPFVLLLIGVLIVAALLLVPAVAWNLLRLRRRWRGVRLLPRQKTVLLLALLWAAVYLVFLFFWLPQNTFYRLFYLPALIIIIGLALSAVPQLGHRRTYATALFVLAVGLANFLFLIYPFSHVEKYPPLEFALQMNREWPRGTVIYYGAQNSDAALVRYFNRSTHWRPLPAELSSLSNNGWLETTAIDRLSADPEGARWLQTHTRKDSLRELNNGANRIRFIALTSPE